jgi:D-glycero-alpha-D-manno-heptose-7-phosphate kinase
MMIIKTPLRVSFFGGSTDYKSYYEKNESLLIGTTVNQFMYTMFRFKPTLLSENSIISYKKREVVESNSDIEHPLVREALKYYEIEDKIDLTLYSDIPARTGLGGSSCFCVSMVYAMRSKLGLDLDYKSIARDAIEIERDILGEAGGIQDQIWPAHGGPGALHIMKDGEFIMTPIAVSPDFVDYLSELMVLIYTDEQREGSAVAESHEENGSESIKRSIQSLAHQALHAFVDSNIVEVGELLTDSYNFKKSISQSIETPQIKNILDIVDGNCYGYKLLGSGGGGFVLALCHPKQKKILIETFGNRVLDIEVEKNGVRDINSV